MIKTGDMVRIKAPHNEIEGFAFSEDREWEVCDILSNGVSYDYYACSRSTKAKTGPLKEEWLIPMGPPKYPFEDQIIQIAYHYLDKEVVDVLKHKKMAWQLAEDIAHTMFIVDSLQSQPSSKKLDRMIIARLLQHMDDGHYFPFRAKQITNYRDFMDFPWGDYQRKPGS